MHPFHDTEDKPSIGLSDPRHEAPTNLKPGRGSNKMSIVSEDMLTRIEQPIASNVQLLWHS